MGYQVNVLICPTCPDHTLDSRKMFLEGNTAVVLCDLCGRKLVISTGLRCKHEACLKPITNAVCSQYTNVPEPVACFCDEHKPKGFANWFHYYFWLHGQDVVPFMPDAIKGKCCKCGSEISCSNKYMFTHCPKCDCEHQESLQLFGPPTLVPVGPDKDERPVKQPAELAASTDGEYIELIARQLCLLEDNQFAVKCPTCGAKHRWDEERTRANEKETLLQAISIMLKMERVARNLGMSNSLNCGHGWLCTQCGAMISHDLLIASFQASGGGWH